MSFPADKLRPSFVFVFAFALMGGGLKFYYDREFKRHADFLKSEGRLLRSLVQDRLRLHERSAVALANLAEELLERGDVSPAMFSALGDMAVLSLPEVLGVNMVDPEGRIVRVHPLRENHAALGKTSQNFSSLKEARERGTRVWLSSPFRFFQGGEGSAYYVSLRRHGRHFGWLGVPMHQDKFFEAFPINGSMGNFHVRVTALSDGTVHFSTTPAPPDKGQPGLAHRRFEVMGRSLRVSTWPRDPGLANSQLPLLLVLALLGASLAAAAWWFFQQRLQAVRKLADLNQLLRLTLHDTANSLAVVQAYLDLQRDNPQLIAPEKITPHVAYVVDLLQQIKLVHRLSDRGPVWRQERQPLLPLFLAMTELFVDRLEDKKLNLDYDPEQLAGNSPSLNGSLFAHSVIGNLLRTAIKSAPRDSTIHVGIVKEPGILELSFRHAAPPPPEEGQDFGFQIARKVVELHGGTLQRGRTPEGGTLVRVRVPA